MSLIRDVIDKLVNGPGGVVGAYRRAIENGYVPFPVHEEGSGSHFVVFEPLPPGQRKSWGPMREVERLSGEGEVEPNEKQRNLLRPLRVPREEEGEETGGEGQG